MLRIFNTPKSHYRKFSGLGIVGHLLGAISYATDNINRVRRDSGVLSTSNTGDIVTEMDLASMNAVTEYFKCMKIPVIVNGEEGVDQVRNPEHLVMLDGIEGTQNAVNGLDHGINISIAPYRPLLKVKDIEAAVVSNLRSGVMYAATREKGAFKVQDGKIQGFSRKPTAVYECPLPNAYTTDILNRLRQRTAGNICLKVLGNQPRSIDATGTRLVALLEGDIRAYVDWRDATKCWDVLPSALILEEEGFVVTDVKGFSFSEGIFYKEGYGHDNGLNRNIGRNFVAATPEDHDKLVFGLEDSFWRRIIGELGFLPDMVKGDYHPTELQWCEDFYEYGRRVGMIFQHQIDQTLLAYGGLNHDNVVDVVTKVRKNFLETISEDKYPVDGPIHLAKFNQFLGNMTDYDFPFLAEKYNYGFV